MMNQGTYKFENIDCMIGMKEYPGKYFDLAIVDPPYGIGEFWKGGDSKNFGYRKDMQSNDKWNIKIPDENYFKELERITKNRIIWGWNYYTKFLGSSDSLIFWDKKMGAPNYSAGEIAYTSFNHKIIIYEESRNSSREGLAIHPCQKSVKLYKWLLSKYAKEGDKILDTHGGSCSSVIAAIDMGFDITCFELDKDYYEAAQKRISDFLSQQVLGL